MAKKYGRLPDDWQKTIQSGFAECWRVLKPNGTLVMKWSENQIPASKMLEAIGRTPLYGDIRGATRWLVFFKEALND